MTEFAEIDKQFGTDNVASAYGQLKAKYDKGEQDKEVLWRLGRACHEMACREKDKAKRKTLIVEGQGFCVEAYNKDSSSFLVLKWVAVLTGQLTDYLSTKEKIAQGHKFQEYLNKALAIDRKDTTLLHMRGRFSFEVTGLSWLERKAAAVLYSTPPTATYDEALADFLAVYEVRPDWVENVHFIVKTYQQLKDKANAKKYLTEGLALPLQDEAERDMAEEMKKMMKKL